MPPTSNPYPTPPSSNDNLFASTTEVVIFSIDEDLSASSQSSSSSSNAPTSSSSLKRTFRRYQSYTATFPQSTATSASPSQSSSAPSSRSRRAVRFAVPPSADTKKRRRLASPEPAGSRISLPMAHMMDSLESLSVLASSCETDAGLRWRHPSPSSSGTASSAGSCEASSREDGDGTGRGSGEWMSCDADGGRRVQLDEMSERHARRWARRAAPY
ncbi:hypothetical protein PENSPDRAFT_693298 [Peniophora sp. CONT]|nr:hypothetical protein PENSPDRAFT_693298 [Peniophora sp. CONT]